MHLFARRYHALVCSELSAGTLNGIYIRFNTSSGLLNYGLPSQVAVSGVMQVTITDFQTENIA